MSNQLTEMDMIIRLALSFAAGAIIGFERASHRQVAGLRTHILISIGATLLMLLSIWLPQQYSGMKGGDPGRIAAQVVSGIGFLGAGAIIRLGNNIRGLTTAASLWLIAAVGLALGAGMYIAAGITEIISLFTLLLLRILETRIFPSARNKILELSYENSNPSTREALKVLDTFGIRIESIDIFQNSGKEKLTKLRLLVGLPTATDIPQLAKALRFEGKVSRIDMKEKF
ncbi:MAG: MgtC/SapB family protein [Spirochaetales bacterium]|jgi:putative Mg2+ transporter-C (MgtC) family protein|nr:MgtC/SapB family protein [Spirochaetales bacterium]